MPIVEHQYLHYKNVLCFEMQLEQIRNKFYVEFALTCIGEEVEGLTTFFQCSFKSLYD